VCQCGPRSVLCIVLCVSELCTHEKDLGSLTLALLEKSWDLRVAPSVDTGTYSGVDAFAFSFFFLFHVLFTTRSLHIFLLSFLSLSGGIGFFNKEDSTRKGGTVQVRTGKPREVQVLYAPTRFTAYLTLANIRGYTRSRVSDSCNIRVFMCSRVSYAIYAATPGPHVQPRIWPRRGVDTRLHM